MKLSCPVYCWSDSEVAICWIRGVKKEWRPWVENRVNVIRTKTPIGQWRHVSGKNNPADIATRQLKLENLNNNKLWWFGPEFIKQQKWPEEKSIAESPEVLIEEKQKSTTANVVNDSESMNIHNIIDIERFSSYNKLLRVTSYVLRFVKRLRHTNEHLDNEISTEEIIESEKLWIRHEQMLQKSRDDNINLILDDDKIQRAKTRISEANNLPYDIRFPIVLQGGRRFVTLLILHQHYKVKHLGVESTLASLRTRLWITKARQNVKKVLSRCVTCKFCQSRAMKSRTEGNLPKERVCTDFPFETTGVDYAGPFYVRDIYGDSKDMNKCYMLLFTCATSRALHLELTPDLGHPALIRALRRFFSRRGVSSLIISDNFTSFKASQVKTFIRLNRVTWKFIVELSPWWGGFYERLVQVVKHCLKKVIGRAALTFEELNTVLTEIEAVVNSRPLTYVSNDLESEPLTPSHLLHGRTIANVYSEAETVLPLNDDDLRNRLKYLQTVLNHYWNRFYHEYTVALRERMIYDQKKRSDDPITVGDVVLIKDDKKTPRAKWKKGRVEKLLPSRDGITRAVEVLVYNPNNGTTSTLKRAIERLVPLEVQPQEKTVKENSVIGRERRNAAVIGEIKRRDNS